MKSIKNFSYLMFFLVFLQSCATIQQGEVGVKQRFGKFSSKPLDAGLVKIGRAHV